MDNIMEPPSQEDSPEQKALRVTIEGLYTSFASYPLRDEMEGCVHCLEQTDVPHLHEVPLRQLTKDDLEFFLDNSAALTVGNAADFKHFLPRLFELMALWSGPYSIGFHPELMGCGVARHGYAIWPLDEQQAVQAFCLAWWKALLNTNIDFSVRVDERVDTVLCAIAQFTDDLLPYLDAWRRQRSGKALAHLTKFIWDYMFDANTRKSRSPWWGSRKPQWEQLVAWIHNPATAAWMRERYRAAIRDAYTDIPPSINRMLDWMASEAINR